ncbi:MAG: EamA family transporter [Deltaproteobacteria bacterium]|nr:MAG: EamA family transporter [Deltaproteobacteria bacterium]
MPPFELALVLLSGLLHASWNAATKGSDTPTSFLLAMEVVSLLLFVPILALGFDPREVPPAVWALVLASALIHAFYAFLLSRAYAHTELSIAYPIVRSTPAFVPFVAVPLLGESVSPLGALGIALVVLSLWAVTADGRFDARAFRSRGARLAYLTLLTTVGYSLVDKEAMRILGEAPWSSRVPPSVAYLTLMFVLYLPCFMLLARGTASAAEVAHVLRTRTASVAGAALVAFVSYVLVLRAMETAPVSYITAVRQSSVLFALAIGVLALREPPRRLRLLGGLANVAGVALIGLFP